MLTVSFLLWAPLTKAIEATPSPSPPRPRRKSSPRPSRASSGAYLGDVILYGGTYRDKVMRPSIQKALCLLTEETPIEDSKPCIPGPYNNPTIIITHSLGGYMLINSIGEELRRGLRDNCKAALDNTAAGRVLANTDYIFMMANQVALLDLTTLRNYPRKLGGSALDNEHARRFAECWAMAKSKSPMVAQPNGDQQAPPAGKQVVAFNDPIS